MFIFILTLVMGCDDAAGTTDEVLSDLGLGDAADCGTINEAAEQCYERPASTADETAQTCLLDAFAACTKAKLEAVQPSIEGDPIRTVYAVAPDDAGGCALIVLVDTTEDEFGPQQITRSDCGGVAAQAACPYLETSDCKEEQLP